MKPCIFYQAYSHDFSALPKVAAVEAVALLTYSKKERKSASTKPRIALPLSVNHVFCMRAYFTLCGCIFFGARIFIQHTNSQSSPFIPKLKKKKQEKILKMRQRTPYNVPCRICNSYLYPPSYCTILGLV